MVDAAGAHSVLERLAHDGILGHAQTATNFGRGMTLRPKASQAKNGFLVPVHILVSQNLNLQDTV